jgi:hypothetical protein
MKTLSNPGIYVLIIVAFFAASCGGNSGSSAASGSAAAATPASTGNSLIDSLQITDPAEVKLCKLYDDALTEYVKRVQIALTDTSKLRSPEYADIDKKFRDRAKELEPQTNSLKATLTTNPMELLKFEKFWIYEAQRMSAATVKLQMAKMPK